jgi:hypothetical protein
MIAVFTSVSSMSIGVEIVGKPKPSAPCVTPARKSAAATADHSGQERSSSDSNPCLLQRVTPVAARKTGERGAHAFAQGDDLEELAHFRG